jgi:hypothetical protein
MYQLWVTSPNFLGDNMSAPTKINFKVYQGSTFNETLRWESAFKTYVPITAILSTAPLTVTASGHTMPVGWRAKITGVVGMVELNTLDYIVSTNCDTNTVTFNSVNPVGFKPYISGGVLEYYTPHDLAAITARMQIRPKVESTTILDELTTENGKIVINDTTKTISIVIPAAETELYTFKTAVYSLELIDGTTVIPFIYGNMTLDNEITR